jgi:hypothetical protein
MDSTPKELVRLVTDKIAELGDRAAAEYFEVSAGTISAWKTLKTFPSIVAAQKVWDDNLLCRSPELWSGTGNEKVAILLPMYEAVEPFFMISFLAALRAYGMENVVIIPKTRTLIEEARNDLIARAQLTKCEYYLFIDVDEILQFGNPAMSKKMGVQAPDSALLLNSITRIMSHPKEIKIVGGLYKDRRGGQKVQCAKAFASPQENARLMGLFDGKTPIGGLEDAGGWCALGFVRFHKSVFTDMLAEAQQPNSPLADILPPPPPRDKEPVGYFGRSSKHRGEDVSLGRRAESIGIPTHIDTSILLGHVGRRVY